MFFQEFGIFEVLQEIFINNNKHNAIIILRFVQSNFCIKICTLNILKIYYNH